MLDAPPSHDERSRFDFAEGVRAFNYRQIVKPLIDDYPRRVAARIASGAKGPATKEEAGELYNHDPSYLFACGVQRAMQQLGWSTAGASVHRHGAAISAQLKASQKRQKFAKLELQRNFKLPDWYTEHDRFGLDEIHLVPGGYWGDELIGAIYDRGGSVYRLAWRAGYDARPGALEEFVRGAPGNNYKRVLDMGCSFGGLTRVLRRVFPKAEVIGIDLSAPALTYAHMLAEDGEQKITYAQRDATATGYDNDSFDLISAFLLLHEVPNDVRRRIVEEAFRLLRPGGHLMFLDIPPYAALQPVEAFFESFDDRANGEYFWEQFLASDFKELLTSVGFEAVEDGALDFDDPGYWGSSALWRTGEFHPANRWVTRAQKPAARRKRT